MNGRVSFLYVGTKGMRGGDKKNFFRGSSASGKNF
jgi:hypothetical protein